jgi:hypothetical protein
VAGAFPWCYQETRANQLLSLEQSNVRMGIYLLHDTNHGVMSKSRSQLFWKGVESKRKCHMMDCATDYKPRESGGLGILNTKFMNIALILKWIWKIY